MRPVTALIAVAIPFSGAALAQVPPAAPTEQKSPTPDQPEPAPSGDDTVSGSKSPAGPPDSTGTPPPTPPADATKPTGDSEASGSPPPR